MAVSWSCPHSSTNDAAEAAYSKPAPNAIRPDITVNISDVLPLLNHSTSKRSLALAATGADLCVAEIVAEAAK